jgi:hypothetical protein
MLTDEFGGIRRKIHRRISIHSMHADVLVSNGLGKWKPAAPARGLWNCRPHPHTSAVW